MFEKSYQYVQARCLSAISRNARKLGLYPAKPRLANTLVAQRQRNSIVQLRFSEAKYSVVLVAPVGFGIGTSRSKTIHNCLAE